MRIVDKLLTITCNYSNNPGAAVYYLSLEMRNGGSERGGDLPMVTQTVSDRAGIETQYICIPEPMLFLGCLLQLPSSSSIFHPTMTY